MPLDIATPALLFPAISLLLLAYTNRFITLANLIRSLGDSYRNKENPRIPPQIRNMRYRLRLIRQMQLYAIAAFLLCVVSMFTVYVNWDVAGQVFFGISLVLLSISLIFSLIEIHISVRALDAALDDLRDLRDQSDHRWHLPLQRKSHEDEERPH